MTIINPLSYPGFYTARALMKKVLSWLLVCVLAASVLAGCRGGRIDYTNYYQPLERTGADAWFERQARRAQKAKTPAPGEKGSPIRRKPEDNDDHFRIPPSQQPVEEEENSTGCKEDHLLIYESHCP